jgi:hypothetical protein
LPALGSPPYNPVKPDFGVSALKSGDEILAGYAAFNNHDPAVDNMARWRRRRTPQITRFAAL